MQIVIPMSGFGERFRRAGYQVPKPLIEIDGKPIIAHVADMFPGESNMIFICNREHLDNPEYRMREILTEICPQSRIVSIEPHKLGPVYAVSKAFEALDLNQPTIVNYCDFSCYWDYDHFKKWLIETNCDGCVPAYRGFHPHSLGTTNYAYLRERNGWMEDIREKQPFTANRMQEYASSGTYYFRDGHMLKKYFEATMTRGLDTNGEYYVSLVYKPMVADGLSVAIYELQHFMQWGTPEDVGEYNYWSRAFSARLARRNDTEIYNSTIMIPMAGEGSRFKSAGYSKPKPLIDVSGQAMVVQATRDLPKASRHLFVIRSDQPQRAELEQVLESEFPGAELEVLEGLTEGQACTCLNAIHRVPEGCLTIAACDSGVLFDTEKLMKLVDNEDIDVIVWVARGYPGAARNPSMYGWVVADASGLVQHVSVKVPLANPAIDPVVIGTFTFRRASDFAASVERMTARDGRVNGEFYVDSCINDAISLGLNCRIFEVGAYLCWGTPNDLKTFEYWQSCFDKWKSHPYSIDKDMRVPRGSVSVLRSRYVAQNPSRLGVQT